MSSPITAATLRNLSLAQLHGLYRQVHQELVRSERGSADRRNALASLETISRAIALRRICDRKSGPSP